MTKDAPKFVQFMHPGYEHGPDEPGWKRWNTRDHRRKFLRAPGRSRPSVGSADERGELLFWGEWEAQSAVTELPGPLQPGLPRWVHTPRLQPLADYTGAQNTDPYVFGDRFLYTCCKQRLRSGRPTQLRFLEPGSLILFGSHVRGQFALDTVFVVADHLDHRSPDDVPAVAAPAGYIDTTLRPMYEMDADYCDPHSVGWRLYHGATPTLPANGTFSFVPARPVDGAPQGFLRPTIAFEGLITSALRQGQKITTLEVAAIREVWHNVVQQVLDHDLVLATALQGPDVDDDAPQGLGGDRRRC